MTICKYKHIFKCLTLICALYMTATCTYAQVDVKYYENYAQKGDKEAMYKLAENLYYGRNGAVRDVKNALLWYERSADRGYAPAQKFIGQCFLNGINVEQNYKLAYKYLNKAAASGDTEAMYDLAEMYRDGLYVKKSFYRYLEYIDKAAAKGNPKALLALARLYTDGSAEAGIAPDTDLALDYYNQAALKGAPEAQYFMGVVYAQNGEMKPAFDNFLLASRGGYSEAYFNTGLCYYLGDGTRQDYKEALLWLKKAAANNVSESYTLIGNIYYYGLGTTANLRTALDYYIKAIESGDEEAITQLAAIYLDDPAMITDQNMIYSMFDNCAIQGQPEGYAGLAVCYEKGIDVDNSDIKAVNYYIRAADSGNGFANYRLYKIYINGELGETKDANKAIDYLRKAVADEYSDAIYAFALELIDGKNIPADQRLGLDYMRRAAEMSNSKASAWLGNAYYSGSNGIARDYNQAFKYLERFLLSPDSVDLDTRRKAYRNISACYRFGRGVIPDQNLADLYTRKAYDTFDIDELLK